MTDRDDGVELRIVVPREALAAAEPARAEYFSQHNAEQLLGVPRRTFLELLRRPDAPRVIRHGKLRLVEREAMLAFLRVLRERAPASAANAEQLDGPDGVLAEIGCTPQRRRRVG